MTRQLWIADRCREFGLDVVEVDGWRTRGSDAFAPRGVVLHHTAGPSTGELPELRVLVNGRSDLSGPLCNVGLARSGAPWIIAAGRANHAGRGGWRGLVGSSSVLGIEAANDGRQPWPQVQVDAFEVLAAALISGPDVGGDVRNVCAHREWAPGRKIDPHTLNMEAFRTAIRFELDGLKEEHVYAQITKANATDATAVILPIAGESAVLLAADFGDGFVRVASGSAAQGWDISPGDKTKVPHGRVVKVPIRAGAELVALKHKGGQPVGARLVR